MKLPTAYTVDGVPVTEDKAEGTISKDKTVAVQCTNTYQTGILVQKIWKDENGRSLSDAELKTYFDGGELPVIRYELVRYLGPETQETVIANGVLNSANNWTARTENQPVCSAEGSYLYKVREVTAVEGWAGSVSDPETVENEIHITVTNTRKPTETTEPSESEPTKPTEPTKPAPTEPTQPTQPSEPAPTQPAEPTPTEPAQPSEPVPTQPAEPTPTQPARPSEPAPTQSAEPTPTQPAEPVTVDIVDEGVPLNPMSGLTEIEDEDVPLAFLAPLTGDDRPVGAAALFGLIALGMMGAFGILAARKDEEDAS